jgi:NAD(P)-dependent dehydrogenase (short-subunit alcohol dehydrogenase family)
VNAIAPGVFRTALNAALLELADRRSRLLARTPLGRFGELPEIAGTAVYLASDASSYMTGAVVALDGGFLAQGI